MPLMPAEYQMLQNTQQCLEPDPLHLADTHRVFHFELHTWQGQHMDKNLMIPLNTVYEAFKLAKEWFELLPMDGAVHMLVSISVS